MKKVIAKLNEKKIFHSTVIKGGEVVAVQVLKQSKMDEKGKDMLREFYGFKDFSVPVSMKDPFVNDSEKLMEKMQKEAEDVANK